VNNVHEKASVFEYPEVSEKSVYVMDVKLSKHRSSSRPYNTTRILPTTFLR
jgi:hypothetical protein